MRLASRCRCQWSTTRVACGRTSRSAAANGADGSTATTSTPARNAGVCRSSHPRTLAPDRPGARPSSPPGCAGSRSTNDVIQGSDRRQPCWDSGQRTDRARVSSTQAAAPRRAPAAALAGPPRPARCSPTTTTPRTPGPRRRPTESSQTRPPPAARATCRSAAAPAGSARSSRRTSGAGTPAPGTPSGAGPSTAAAAGGRTAGPSPRTLRPWTDALSTPQSGHACSSSRPSTTTSRSAPAPASSCTSTSTTRNPSRPNNSVVASLMLVAPKLADSTPTTLRRHEPYALTTCRSPSTAKSRETRPGSRSSSVA